MICARTLIALLMLVVSAGCSSLDRYGLVSENDVPALAAMKAEAAQHPTHTRHVEAMMPGAVPVDIAVHEVGTADGPCLIFLHGAMSDHSTWRFVVGPLAHDARVLLVDLPGCGASEIPNEDHIDATCSPEALAWYVLDALSQVNAFEADEPIAIVGHSVGATVALHMMTDPHLRGAYATAVEAVDGLVLISPVAPELPHPPEVITEIVSTSDFAFDVARLTGILHRRCCRSVVMMTPEGGSPLREEAVRRIECLSDRGKRRAAKAMLRSITPRVEGELDMHVVDRLHDQFSTLTTPCLIVAGAEDAILTPAVTATLCTCVPTSSIEVLEDVHHSWQIERPGECCERIERFVRELEAGRGQSPFTDL